jgi:hypothetical protein
VGKKITEGGGVEREILKKSEENWGGKNHKEEKGN